MIKFQKENIHKQCFRNQVKMFWKVQEKKQQQKTPKKPSSVSLCQFPSVRGNTDTDCFLFYQGKTISAENQSHH